MNRGYISILLISMKNQLVYTASFLFNNLFFVLIMFVFFSLWKAIFSESSVMSGLSLNQTIWYLTFSETIVLSASTLWQEISTDVKDGTLAYSMLRPYNYPIFKLFQGLGETIVKLIPLLAVGFILALLLVGPLDGYFYSIGPAFVLIVLGQVSIILSYISIGLISFWMEEVSPIFWIWQKALFIFGGMFLPLDFFPDWSQPILKRLPFAYGIYWPSRMVVEFNWDIWTTTLIWQLVWITISISFVLFVFSRARKQVQLQGG